MLLGKRFNKSMCGFDRAFPHHSDAYTPSSADSRVGRRHFPITIGRKASSSIYGLFHILTYITIVAGVVTRIFPVFSLLGLLTIIPAVKSYLGARKSSDNIPELMPSMGLNVVVNLLTPVLLAIGIFIG